MMKGTKQIRGMKMEKKSQMGVQETERGGKEMKRLPARKLENSDPFGLGIIRTAKNSKNSTHDEEEEGLTQQEKKKTENARKVG